MLTVDEALAAVLDHARALPPVARAARRRAGLRARRRRRRRSRFTPVRQGAGRWLRGAVERPARARTAGFAWARRSWRARRPRERSGRARRPSIMTGAPIPPGCDAVVMHERTRPGEDGVLVLEPEVKPGQNLLPRGREMRAGEVVVARGSILRPARLGVLASVGRTEVTGRAATAGRDRADRRRAGRARPGARAGPDPQLERRAAPCPGDRGRRARQCAADRPRRSGPARRDSRARARMRIF